MRLLKNRIVIFAITGVEQDKQNLLPLQDFGRNLHTVAYKS